MNDVSGVQHRCSHLLTAHVGDVGVVTSIPSPTARKRPPPFVTISQQVGVGLRSLPERLVGALNAQSPSNQAGWTAWDRGVIEKVAKKYHIPVQLIESIEESGYSWIETFLSAFGGLPDEIAMVHRVRDTVRELAAPGYVVLMGHGSVFMTRDMPGGIHIRLVAPLRLRIENFAHCFQVSTLEAAARLKLAQRNWISFLKRFWPICNLAPETFAATLNTAVLDEERLVKCIVSLVT